jgi:predicted esterase
MHTGSSPSMLSPEVESLIKSTVLKIQSQGSRVVGLIGFSQGTKIVAGLLRASELRKELGLKGEDVDWCDFELGLSVCGSYPPFLFPESVRKRLPEGRDHKEGKIRKPTFHVQGKQDEWMWAGQGLIEKHYETGEGMSEVVEWDMGHHYPVLPEESERIANWMIAVLKKVDEGKEAR